ncbi:hypothetical protein SAMN06298216_2297 [Spirosomataceae bacterium TFI 002]|nr:hypothetical protein SAMN06298216_2297 [Spirosomataceae bacterium TFI 002]
MSLILFLIFVYLVTSSVTYLASGLIDWLLKSFLFAVAFIIPTGYLLSVFNVINSSYIFLGLLIFWALLFRLSIHFFNKSNPISILGKFRLMYAGVVSFWKQAGTITKLFLTILGVALAFVSGLNILVMFITYPNEWDSMTGHLVKCAYYLQNGNMDRLQGTSWTIDFYPNALPTIQIFGYHVFGEKGFKLIHFVSYWVFVLSTAGVTGIIFKGKRARYFVFLIAALLPSALIQAVTTETDIIQSAYLGVVIYFLLMLKGDFSKANLYFFALSMCVWMSHKVTFILIGPAFFVVFAYVFWLHRKSWKLFIPAKVFFIVGLLIYVLPNGYYANVKEVGKFSLGALSAPPEVMKWHGIENYSSTDKFRNLKLNGIRYTSDFLHLDGIRNTEFGSKVNAGFRVLPNMFFDKFDLGRDEFWVVAPFEMMGDPNYEFFRERPFWGVIGFLLIPLALILFVRRRKELDNSGLIVVFLVAFVVHFLSLCFSAPYDPIKGRYFLNTSIWLLPLLGIIDFKKKTSLILLPITILIAWSAISTLTHRRLYPTQGENSIFKLNRVEQITSTRPEFTDAYLAFEKMVPTDAVVALGTQQEHEDYIYPLWGAEFKRKLIPIHPFRSSVKPIPAEAEYLFYSEGVIPFKEGDIQLGEGDKTQDTPVPESKYFLRKLKTN